MANLYHDTAEPADDATPLDADMHADVVVIGGGLTGLSTALHLAERGTRVVLLEAHAAGWGASGRNGGQVNPGLKPDPEVVERDHGIDMGRRMNAFAGAAPAYVFDLIERHAIKCDARRNGTLRAAIHARHEAQVRATAGQLAARGAPVDMLDAKATAALTGTTRYRAAMFDRRGGDLNPLSFARGLARVARLSGARICGASRALHLERIGAAWRVRTAAGSVTAERLVLATNGYTDDLWPQLKRSIVPVFGAIAATAPLPDAVARDIMPGRAVLYETGAVTVYYRLDREQRLLIGGRGPMHEVTRLAEIPHLLAYARTLWPALEHVPWTHAWGGQLAMTADHYPHLHEPEEGVLICLGYNGRGVALSTAMGALIARRLLDRDAPSDMPITRAQSIPLQRFWRLGVRAAIARGRCRDFLGI